MTKKIKEQTKKMPKHFMSFIMIFGVLFGYFASITNVFAESFGSGDYFIKFGLNDHDYPVNSVTINGENWSSSNSNDEYHSTNDKYTIEISTSKKGNSYPDISYGGNFNDCIVKSARVSGNNYIFTLVVTNPPQNNLNVEIVDGPPITSKVSANVNITISGDELEYHYANDKPNEADVSRFKFGINSGHSDDIVPFTFGNATFKNNIMPPNAIGVSTTNSIQYEYDYDGSGFVTFYVNGAASDEYTKIEINGVNYSNQAPHNQIEFFEHLIGRALIFEIHNVPYAETYNVVVEGNQTSLDNTVAGFGWSYLNRERSGLSEEESEGNFAHGRLEFVSAKYTDIDGETHTFSSANEYNRAKFHRTGEIYEWKNGRKDYSEEDRREAWGEALVPYGTELTVRIVPDSGYQLTGLAKSPTGFTATNEVGVYKMVFTQENFLYKDGGFDLQPIFEEIGAEVIAHSENIKSGNLDINAEFENGTAKLEVNDVPNPSSDSTLEFENKATIEGYNIENYLDISLYNSIYKGGKKDVNGKNESWDTPIENIDNKATITLELQNDMSGKNLALIHEKHNGNTITEYELIDAVYNEENNTITFETDSFSNYAIVSKTIEDDTKYIVHFDSRGGSQVEDKEVTSGNSVAKPANPTNGNLIFEGWYEDQTLTIPFDFNTPITTNVTLYARWQENEENNNNHETEKYTIKDNKKNIITFNEEKGREFYLSITDYLSLRDEDLENAGISKEMYNEIFEAIRNATKNYGTLLAFYEIEVINDDGFPINKGPFNIKIKMAPEMKKYNTFKLIYVDTDNNLNMEEPINLTVEGDYLVGRLEHLSAYALTGSYKAPTNNLTANNPQTKDNIYMWIGMLLISVLGLSIGMATATKLKKSKL